MRLDIADRFVVATGAAKEDRSRVSASCWVRRRMLVTMVFSKAANPGPFRCG